ncbi:hypothetical protein OROMI_030479 [Orobanche minor]
MTNDRSRAEPGGAGGSRAAAGGAGRPRAEACGPLVLRASKSLVRPDACGPLVLRALLGGRERMLAGHRCGAARVRSRLDVCEPSGAELLGCGRDWMFASHQVRSCSGAVVTGCSRAIRYGRGRIRTIWCGAGRAGAELGDRRRCWAIAAVLRAAPGDRGRPPRRARWSRPVSDGGRPSKVLAYNIEFVEFIPPDCPCTEDSQHFNMDKIHQNHPVEMDASKYGTKAEEAGTSSTIPEYNSNTIKKARLQSTLTALLNDPILADVPKKPSLSDVDTLINLELGSAMRITILKLDGTSFEVVMMNSATVKDLKLAIKKKVNDMEESSMGHRHISCVMKHVWSNFCLSCHNEKLLDDNASLQDYGIRNNSQVQFIPYVVSRAFRKHTRSRKHRFFHGLNRKA